MQDIPREVEISFKEVTSLIDGVLSLGPDTTLHVEWVEATSYLKISPGKLGSETRWLLGTYTLYLVEGDHQVAVCYSNQKGEVSISLAPFLTWLLDETWLVLREGDKRPSTMY